MRRLAVARLQRRMCRHRYRKGRVLLGRPKSRSQEASGDVMRWLTNSARARLISSSEHVFRAKQRSHLTSERHARHDVTEEASQQWWIQASDELREHLSIAGHWLGDDNASSVDGGRSAASIPLLAMPAVLAARARGRRSVLRVDRCPHRGGCARLSASAVRDQGLSVSRTRRAAIRPARFTATSECSQASRYICSRRSKE